MRKKIISSTQKKTQPSQQECLNLEKIATVELTSEDINFPIESAFISDQSLEWRAAEPGKQVIRLVFDDPQQLQIISLNFEETQTERTQEYVLRWSAEDGQFHEIVRQQWNFSPEGNNYQKQEHQVDLQGVSVLELMIIPDINGGDARASLAQLRLT